MMRNKIKVAIARELCGFVWALLQTCDCYRQPTASQRAKGSPLCAA
jgi:hypothetical protein